MTAVFRQSENSIKVSRIRLFLVLAVAMLICGMVARLNLVVSVIITILVIAIALTVWFKIFPMRYNNFIVEVSEKYVFVRSGLYFAHFDLMPNKSAIFAQRIQFPFMRLFGLCSVKLNCARRSLVVPLIDIAVADELIKFLKIEQ